MCSIRPDADVIATTNLTEACTGVSIAIMVGGYPRKTSMERKDVMAMNGSIYKMHASALEKYACKDCKVCAAWTTACPPAFLPDPVQFCCLRQCYLPPCVAGCAVGFMEMVNTSKVLVINWSRAGWTGRSGVFMGKQPKQGMLHLDHKLMPAVCMSPHSMQISNGYYLHCD